MPALKPVYTISFTVSCIVIEYYYFGFNARFTECRPKKLLHKKRLFGLIHQHTWVIIWVFGLILEGNGFYFDPLAYHRFDVVHEVVGIDLVKLQLQTSSL